MAKLNHPEWMGKMRGLTPDEMMDFLAAPVVARLATVDPDGMPYIVPVWQEWDGEAMWIVPREKSVFVQHIVHNSNVAISCAIDDGANPRILMRGTAEITFGPAAMEGKCLEVATRMARRYLGERGPEYLVPTLDRPRYLLKFVPKTVVSWEGTEWHTKYTS